jgi:uncharacterized phage protein (TIGR01671 family)
MRELKFRIWEPKRNRYAEDYTRRDNLMNIFNGKLVSNVEDDSFQYDELEYYKEGSYVLEQFTGDTSLDGIELYEGDILEFGHQMVGKCDIHSDFIGVVKFLEYGFYVDNGEQAFPLFQEGDGWHKLGNIHENQELLEGQNEHS